MRATAQMTGSAAWIRTTLGAITEESVQHSGPPESGGFVYVDISSIDNDAKRISEPKTLAVSKAPTRARQNLKSNDVLVSMTRPNLNAVAIVPAELNGAVGSTGFHVLRARDVEPKWLFYAVQDRAFVEAMSSLVQGALYPAVRPKDIRAHRVLLPSRAEQRRIVGEIERQFTRLDAGVAALRRVQANLKRYRASVLKAACEGRLVPTEGELARRNGRAYETGAHLLSRILIERRDRWRGRGAYEEAAVPETKPLATLSEGWAYASVGAVGLVQLGRQRSPKDHSGRFMRPYLRVANVYEDRLDLTDVKEMNFTPAEFRVFQLLPNDILLNEGQSLEWVGRPAIYGGEIPGACFQNTLVRFRPSVSVNPRFALTVFRAFMHEGQFQKIAKWTTNIAHLGATRFAEMGFPLPPLSEQGRIVAEVERLLSVAQSAEAIVSATLQRAGSLRQSVLQRAFAGELVAIEREQPPQSVSVRRPNRHFARAVLSAEIVHQLHSQPTFGRVKHQKILHLCEHIAQITELGGQYHREAAGPLDNKMIFANEDELKKQKWYATFSRPGYGHAYQPMAKAGGHRTYLERHWPEKIAAIERLIELMRKWDTDTCEMFSTAYAAWNDLLIWRREATEEAILNEILNRWSPEKRRFDVKRWRGVIAWMKAEGFAPTGFGHPTCSPE